MASRRVIYLKTILNRSEVELTRKIYNAQKVNPTTGDWYTMVNQDFNTINEVIDEDKIRNMSDNQYKNLIKNKVRK